MCREIWAIYDRHGSVHRLSLYHLRVHGPLAKGAATCILYVCEVAGDWPRSCDGRLQSSPVVLRENPSDKNLAIFVTSLFKGGKRMPGLFTESDNSRAANQVRGVSSFPGHEAVASFQNHMTYIRILKYADQYTKTAGTGRRPRAQRSTLPRESGKRRDRGGTNVLV